MVVMFVALKKATLIRSEAGLLDLHLTICLHIQLTEIPIQKMRRNGRHFVDGIRLLRRIFGTPLQVALTPLQYCKRYQ